MRAMFGFYGLMGIAVWHLYRTTSTPDARLPRGDRHAALGESRAVVMKLAALFSVDAFAGGLS